jgi:DNA-binding transcriptional LysR family regulator
MYSFYLPEKILNFRKLYSDCRFSIGYHYTSEILNSVLNNQYELGICGNFEPSGKFSSIDYCTLYKEPIRFIVGREHPFAKREKVSVDELKNESFIVYFRSYWGTNKIIYDMCESAGFEPNIVAEGYNDFGVINLVASGEGIAIIPASGYLNSDSVVSINIDYDIPLTRDINVIWNTNESLPAIVSKFRDTLISQSAVAPVSLS